MRLRSRLGCLALAAVVVVGCAAETTSPAPTSSRAVATATAPQPQGSSNPCPGALNLVAAFSQRLADDLAGIRSHVAAKTYRGPETVAALRPVAATFTAYQGLEANLADCDSTVELATNLELLRSDAAALLERAMGDANVSTADQRKAAADLFALLPDVLALSAAGGAIAQTLGTDYTVAEVPDGAADPIGALAPLPTPKPTPPSNAVVIEPSFFGDDVRITTFKVTGETPDEISTSIGRNGPFMAWLGGSAAGVTKPKVAYRFHLSSGSGGCRIVVDARPAIKVTYTIVLPRWTPTVGTPQTAVRWWNDEVRDIATHEKGHVRIVRDAVRELNKTLSGSTCANAERRLNAIWKEARRDNCEFDMKEYGTAAGLSMKACMAN